MASKNQYNSALLMARWESHGNANPFTILQPFLSPLELSLSQFAHVIPRIDREKRRRRQNMMATSSTLYLEVFIEFSEKRIAKVCQGHNASSVS